MNSEGNIPSPVSQLMVRINQDALKRSRNMVTKKFTDPVDLDDVTALISQLKKQLVLADSQLNVAVQGKLDALKRADDIMSESSVKLSRLSRSLHEIDERIANTNTAISEFLFLSRIHHVRDNIANVISRVDFFARVPQKVQGLNDLLESDPDQLKDIFLEALKLEALRKALIKEIQVSRSYRRSSIAGQSGRGVDSESKLRNSVEDQLRMVPDLMATIRERLLNTIERFFDVALDLPEDLVMCFEIIEMHQEYMNRRRDQRIKAEIDDITDDDFEDLVGDVGDRLGRIISEKIEGHFSILQVATDKKGKNANKDQSQAGSRVEQLFDIATQVIEDLATFKNYIVPCIPPSYNALNLFIDSFEGYFLPEVISLTQGDSLSSLKVADFLKVINWIDFYKQTMENYECGHRSSIGKLVYLSAELLNEYLIKIKTQLLEWLGNLRQLEKELKQTNEGNLISSEPEDMLNLVHQQLNVALENLSPDHLYMVINCCLEVLRGVQRESSEALSMSKKDDVNVNAPDKRNDNGSKNASTEAVQAVVFDVEYLCALLNDNLRLGSESCYNLFSRYIKRVPLADHREVLNAVLHELSDGYIKLADTIVDNLARSALFDLNEEVFSKLFKPEWEGRDGTSIVPVLTATLQDYFKDISGWIPEKFYAKFTKSVFLQVIGLYVMSLRKLAKGDFHINSEMTVMGRITYDMKTLESFFLKHESALQMGGLLSKDPDVSSVSEHLQSLKCMATIFNANDISGVKKQIEHLFIYFGGDGLKLVQAIIMSLSTLNKSEKLQKIDNVSKLFETTVKAGKCSSSYSDVYKDYDNFETESAKAPKKESKGWFLNRNR